jgi:uncharacterized membrane protein YbhN (UPF0104 family)
MSRRITHYIGPIIGITLFCASAWVLSHEIKQLDFDRVIHEFRSIGLRQVTYSVLLTVVSYLVLTLYDATALVYVGEKLSYLRIALASFVGYTISHNLGFSLVSGGAARYRLFSSWGISAGQVARAITFSGLTYWLGFFFLTGLVLLIDPPTLPPSLGLAPKSMNVLGLCFVTLVLIYLGMCAERKTPYCIWGWELPLPSVKLTLLAIVIASVDWCFATSVNYILLPTAQISYIHFASIFLVGQVIGILSFVPGGLGVYETMLVYLLSEQIDPNTVLGCLIAYRIIYYLIPISISLTMMLIHEIRLHKNGR